MYSLSGGGSKKISEIDACGIISPDPSHGTKIHNNLVWIKTYGLQSLCISLSRLRRLSENVSIELLTAVFVLFCLEIIIAPKDGVRSLYCLRHLFYFFVGVVFFCIGK